MPVGALTPPLPAPPTESLNFHTGGPSSIALPSGPSVIQRAGVWGSPAHRHAHLILSLYGVLPVGKIKEAQASSLLLPSPPLAALWFAVEGFLSWCFVLLCPWLVLKNLSFPSVYFMSIFWVRSFSFIASSSLSRIRCKPSSRAPTPHTHTFSDPPLASNITPLSSLCRVGVGVALCCTRPLF